MFNKKEYMRKWEIINKEDRRNYKKKYNNEHKEKINEYQIKWREKNKEKIEKYKKYNIKIKKEKKDIYRKNYYKKHPERYKAYKYTYKHNQKEKECKICGSIKNLHFHHTDYINNKGITLCRDCHFKIHNQSQDLKLEESAKCQINQLWKKT